MRRVWVWLALLVVPAISVALSASQASAPAQQPIALGVISGTVTRAGSTEALGGVVVSVEVPAQKMRALLDAAGAGATNIPAALLEVARRAAVPGMATTSVITISVTTDAAGRFTVTVPEGPVIVSATRDEYLSPTVVYGSVGTVVTESVVVSAQRPAAVQLELMRGSTISGRVIDQAGRPVPHLGVYSLGRFYSWSGVPALSWTAGTETDDQGRYRLSGLGPGERYVLAVRSPQQGPSSAPAGEAVVSTYYPHVIDSATATAVTVRSGDDATGIDIQLRTARTYTVNGRIASALPALNNLGKHSLARITLVPRLPVLIPDVIASATQLANADGTFVLQYVQNGTYDVLARVPVAKGWGLDSPPDRATDSWAFGRTTVVVRDGNLTGVSVPVHQGQDVRGRVIVDDKPNATAVGVTLMPDDLVAEYSPVGDALGSFSPRVEQDGSFLFPVMPEGRYRFNFSITPLSTYVDDVQMNGATIYDAGLTIGTDPIGRIDVIARADGGTVEGFVIDDDSKPVWLAAVVLVPDNHRPNPMRYAMTTSSEKGQFHTRPVAPGAYKLFAWDSAVVPGQWQDAEFLQKYESLGVPVTVPAGGKAKVDVRVIQTAR